MFEIGKSKPYSWDETEFLTDLIKKNVSNMRIIKMYQKEYGKQKRDVLALAMKLKELKQDTKSDTNRRFNIEFHMG